MTEKAAGGPRSDRERITHQHERLRVERLCHQSRSSTEQQIIQLGSPGRWREGNPGLFAKKFAAGWIIERRRKNANFRFIGTLR